MNILKTIAGELGVELRQVEAAVKLIDEGATIPFIARYRKEATGKLDDEQLRALDSSLTRLRALEERKETVKAAIDGQGKLTPELEKALETAQTLAEIEDIYRPYKQKRRTRAGIAKDKGLEPLADRILEAAAGRAESCGSLRKEAETFVTASGSEIEESMRVADAEEALRGARDIIAERISDDADIRKNIRERTFREGTLRTAAKKLTEEARKGKNADRASVYEMYADYEEKVSKIPGHRVLAVNRGENEKLLSVKLEVPENMEEGIAGRLIAPAASGTQEAEQVREAAQDAYDRLIAPSVEREIRSALTEKAEDGAIEVFSKNLAQLLMQPPIEGKVVLGWDPAFRTGCKLAVVDPTGMVLDTKVIFPTAPQNRVEESKREVEKMVAKYGITLISLGNGTASRESEAVITEIIREVKTPLQYVVVNEAGASVYSASPLATEEFPNFDVGQRSAASMARRLQDPLAELVKIDPKAVGVGQYQHDMDQGKLSGALDGVVEDCVNRVGVDLNTASFSLLSRVSGISPAVAKNIVEYRNRNGRFRSRKQLLEVPKLGPKAFEQCAGFLRIRGGDEFLDSTAVHPESYGAVKKLIRELGLSDDPESLKTASSLVKNRKQTAGRIGVGEETLSDILEELKKPGRDPREEMPRPVLRSDVLTAADLKPGMKLKGTVRNIVDFGAFVDIGVHQDGLVHISRLSDRFIKHPLEAVSVGDVVEVTVVSVDPSGKRIALSMNGKM